MNTCTRFLVAALLMALVVSVSAAPIVIPKNSVIPVTLDATLSSATTSTGATFYAHHNGINGAGFPENTRFTGDVDSVTRASGNTAGQIGVSFASAQLPGGTSVPITGRLTSLDDRSVTTDPSTGRLVGTTQARQSPAKFVAIGAGAGLVLGQVIGKKPLIGTILGAAAGWLYGAKKATPAVGRNVLVPEGTRFGILMAEDVTIPEFESVVGSASTGTGPAGPGWQVTFGGLQPVMSGNDLMVPFRSVMGSIEMPFDYNSATRQVSVSNYDTQTLHTVGTRIMNVDGKDTRMDTASRIASNGSLYVPASYIELLTDRTAYWNQRSGVLRIE